MKSITWICCFILGASTVLFASDWPQYKRTPDRQACNLAESITLPTTLCGWFDFGSPILASPAVVNGKAYVLSSRGLLACLDLDSNRVAWSRSLGGVSNECSPAVGSGKVYVGTTAGVFYVLDAADGAVLHSYNAGGAVFAAPLLMDNGVYFGSFGGVFHALDLDGNLKWTDTAMYKIMHAAAAYKGQIVYSDGDNNLIWLEDSGTYCKKIRVVHNAEANNTTHSGFSCAPMIWNDTVYTAYTEAEMLNMIALFDFNTGVKSREFDFLGTGGASRSGVSVDTASGMILVPSANAGMYVKPWPNQGTMAVWSSCPDGLYGVNTAPAVIGNCVIFGAEHNSDTGGCAVYFRNKANGSSLWSYRPASYRPFASSSAVSDGKAVIGCMDGCVYGFWNGTAVTSPTIVDTTGNTGVATRNASLPGTWTLSAFPNPATGGNVTLSSEGFQNGATLFVYDVAGRLQRRLPLDKKEIQWDLKDNRGRALASGNYGAVVLDRKGKQTRTFTIQVVK